MKSGGSRLDTKNLLAWVGMGGMLEKAQVHFQRLPGTSRFLRILQWYRVVSSGLEVPVSLIGL